VPSAGTPALTAHRLDLIEELGVPRLVHRVHPVHPIGSHRDLLPAGPGHDHRNTLDALTIYRECSRVKASARLTGRAPGAPYRARVRFHSPDRYGTDVLATDWRAPRRGRATETAADPGLVVEEVTTDWCGEIVRVERDLGTVTLEDRHGQQRTFPLGPGFLLEGRPVVLVAPTRRGPARRTRTASGSVAVPAARARVARASRILVEGRHDAELVEKVWGEDLRLEGVVVEYLEGVDDLPAKLRTYEPGPQRRIGVLVDHLVPGSKESRIAEQVRRSALGAHVLVVGHPYVDIWAAVLPERLGMPAWPSVPRDVEWKVGVCRSLGWPSADQADLGRAWKRVLGAVRDYRVLVAALLGRVEELIDFVTGS
jgi:hypothetical protein